MPGLSSRTDSRMRNGVSTRWVTALIVVTSNCGPCGLACKRCKRRQAPRADRQRRAGAVIGQAVPRGKLDHVQFGREEAAHRRSRASPLRRARRTPPASLLRAPDRRAPVAAPRAPATASVSGVLALSNFDRSAAWRSQRQLPRRPKIEATGWGWGSGALAGQCDALSLSARDFDEVQFAERVHQSARHSSTGTDSCASAQPMMSTSSSFKQPLEPRDFRIAPSRVHGASKKAADHVVRLARAAMPGAELAAAEAVCAGLPWRAVGCGAAPASARGLPSMLRAQRVR
jgi:hypothetical protein